MCSRGCIRQETGDKSEIVELDPVHRVAVGLIFLVVAVGRCAAHAELHCQVAAWLHAVSEMLEARLYLRVARGPREPASRAALCRQTNFEGHEPSRVFALAANF